MNTQILQEAAEWLIDLQMDEPDAAARERFVGWLRTSPEHVRAYLELVTDWEDARHYDPAHQVDVDTLVALARSDTNVVTLDSTEDPTPVGHNTANPHGKPGQTRRRRAIGIGIAAALGVLALGALLMVRYGTVYSTGVGEQRTVKLPDGSVAELNAVSRIRVHFSDDERIIDLLEGEALFRVAKNKERPFIVLSGATHVRAVGTEFDVNRKPTGTVITVLEGRVAVDSQANSRKDPNAAEEATAPVEVSAGEQLKTNSSVATAKSRTNVASATAWTQQQLIFDSTRLAEVAEEFNRFNSQKLIIEGDAVRDMRISGNFPALDPTSLQRFVRFLRTEPGINIVESPERILVTPK